MGRFIVRVEIVGEKSFDYDVLHSLLIDNGYDPVILGKTGLYDLPPAEYRKVEIPDISAVELRDRTMILLNQLNANIRILVTKYVETAWRLHQRKTSAIEFDIE